MHYTYVMQSIQDGRWYTGHSSDRRARIDDHLKGRVESTRHRRPLQLIYYGACLTEADAKRRERCLKTGKGKRYLRQRLATGLGNSRK